MSIPDVVVQCIPCATLRHPGILARCIIKLWQSIVVADIVAWCIIKLPLDAVVQCTILDSDIVACWIVELRHSEIAVQRLWELRHSEIVVQRLWELRHSEIVVQRTLELWDFNIVVRAANFRSRLYLSELHPLLSLRSTKH